MPESITQQSTEQIAASNETSRAQERIKQLSEKIELTAKDRDEKNALIEARDKEIAQLKQENIFNSGFADVLGNYPAAKDFKEDIRAKVLAGYTPEDAAFAVLGKAGKLGQAIATPSAGQVAGGSSTTTPTGGTKSVSEMTQAERREALAKELGFV